MSGIIVTALELGLINAIAVLALFLSYQMLNVCDLSTDGCFTLGAAVGATAALQGHPLLSLLAAMLSGMLSGSTVSFLQRRMGIDALLSAIIVNTGLYSVNIAIMGNASIVNLNKTETVFTLFKSLLNGTVLSPYYRLIVIVLFVVVIVLFLNWFLKTRLGLAIRATGSNRIMVASSSIDADRMTMIALCISGSMTALSGCLLGQLQKSAGIDIGSGILTIALASLLIGRIFYRHDSPMLLKICASVLGAFVFRIIYALSLRLHIPAFMLKLISSLIVALAISIPYFYRMYLDRKQVNSQKEVEHAADR